MSFALQMATAGFLAGIGFALPLKRTISLQLLGYPEFDESKKIPGGHYIPKMKVIGDEGDITELTKVYVDDDAMELLTFYEPDEVSGVHVYSLSREPKTIITYLSDGEHTSRARFVPAFLPEFACFAVGALLTSLFVLGLVSHPFLALAAGFLTGGGIGPTGRYFAAMKIARRHDPSGELNTEHA